MSHPMSLPSLRSLFRMAWELALALIVLNLIFDLLESFGGFSLPRLFVSSPFTTVKSLVGSGG